MCDEKLYEVTKDNSMLFLEKDRARIRELQGPRKQPIATDNEIANQTAQTKNYPIILKL